MTYVLIYLFIGSAVVGIFDNKPDDKSPALVIFWPVFLVGMACYAIFTLFRRLSKRLGIHRITKDPDTE